ncbi:hypothetical protein NDU88_002724 [Pleurodeles waltl]|uniref:Reverse transcriptase RNase H-like domain-containing protein n=1 Tax=Pleurodeles waltl TaxID=8319 RepID=A0AAV7VF74_PLEWA|nr:hypothetical protein NDU88_002724 [Pleurodeles waltl]
MAAFRTWQSQLKFSENRTPRLLFLPLLIPCQTILHALAACSRLSPKAALESSDWRCSCAREDSVPRCHNDKEAGACPMTLVFRVPGKLKSEDGLDPGAEDQDVEEPAETESGEPEDNERRSGDPGVPREAADPEEQERSEDTLRSHHVPGGAWLTKFAVRQATAAALPSPAALLTALTDRLSRQCVIATAPPSVRNLHVMARCEERDLTMCGEVCPRLTALLDRKSSSGAGVRLLVKCKALREAGEYAGGGVMLLQMKDRGEWVPIAYASRALTDEETRYAQIEKEALAIRCGHTFQVIMDRKLLVPLFASRTRSFLPRIERGAVQLQQYSFEVA